MAAAAEVVAEVEKPREAARVAREAARVERAEVEKARRAARVEKPRRPRDQV